MSHQAPAADKPSDPSPASAPEPGAPTPPSPELPGETHAAPSTAAAAAVVTVSHYLVVDFEATCDASDEVLTRLQQCKVHEIIEFPCIVLDASTMTEVSRFHEYVRPVERPVLSSFCSELTGISQATVDAADPLPEVLARFLAWLDAPPLRLGQALTSGAAALVTHGEWDIGDQLRLEAYDRKGLALPPALRAFVDLKVPFAEAMGPGPTSIARMLARLDLRPIGRAHSGIDDSRNLGAVMAALLRLDSKTTLRATQAHKQQGTPEGDHAGAKAGVDLASPTHRLVLFRANGEDDNVDRAGTEAGGGGAAGEPLLGGQSRLEQGVSGLSSSRSLSRLERLRKGPRDWRDWECSACLSECFGRSVCCYRCGAFRDPASPAYSGIHGGKGGALYGSPPHASASDWGKGSLLAGKGGLGGARALGGKGGQGGKGKGRAMVYLEGKGWGRNTAGGLFVPPPPPPPPPSFKDAVGKQELEGAGGGVRRVVSVASARHPAYVGAVAAVAGDWTCSWCDAHVFASRRHCFNCRAPRSTHPDRPQLAMGLRSSCSPSPCHPSAPPVSLGGGGSGGAQSGLRVGDWWCERCAVLVFGRRPNCFKCHAPPRPSPSAGTINGPSGVTTAPGITESGRKKIHRGKGASGYWKSNGPF